MAQNDAINYKLSQDETVRCFTCGFYEDKVCTRWDFAPNPDWVCDSFKPGGPVITEPLSRATDFPTKGDDKKISLRNSQYPQFDYDYALDLKENHPDIWEAGGNVRGNEAFVLWGRARDGQETDAILDWIKEREAWAARHEGNFRLAGVVAAVKWGVIVTRGQSYMKELINEEKEGREKMPNYLRAYVHNPDEIRQGEVGSPIRFVIASEGVKRDGLNLSMAGARLDNFLRNPVVLWSHDYLGNRPPIGRAMNLDIEGDKLFADVVFDQDDEFARGIDKKYRGGILNAVSIGWDTVRASNNVIEEWELIDVSAVNIPGDPMALAERQKVALRNLQREIDEILDDDSTNVSGDVETFTTLEESEGLDNKVVQLVEDYLKQRKTIAPDKAEISWSDIAVMTARLMQEADEANLEAAYRFLVAHYREFDKEPPSLRTIQEFNQLFADPDFRSEFMRPFEAEHSCRLRDPEDFDDDTFRRISRETEEGKRYDVIIAQLEGEDNFTEQAYRYPIDIWTETEAREHCDSHDGILFEPAMGSRAGAVLSKRNQEDLQEAVRLIQSVLSRAVHEDKEEEEEEMRFNDAEIEYLLNLQETLEA